MPMTARTNLFTMSPELLHKLETSGHVQGQGEGHDPKNDTHRGPQGQGDQLEAGTPETIFNVLDKTLEMSGELIMPKECLPDKANKDKHEIVEIDDTDLYTSTDSLTSIKSTNSSSTRSNGGDDISLEGHQQGEDNGSQTLFNVDEVNRLQELFTEHRNKSSQKLSTRGQNSRSQPLSNEEDDNSLEFGTDDKDKGSTIFYIENESSPLPNLFNDNGFNRSPKLCDKIKDSQSFGVSNNDGDKQSLKPFKSDEDTESFKNFNSDEDTQSLKLFKSDEDTESVKRFNNDEDAKSLKNFNNDEDTNSLELCNDDEENRSLRVVNDDEDERSLNLFDVSVDISEYVPSDRDSNSAESEIISVTTPSRARRKSHWSATVLFVASDVQLTVNLADLCRPDGYEMAPKRKKDSEDDKMSDCDSAVELQPMDNSDTNSDQPITSEDRFQPDTYSNGDIVQEKDFSQSFDKHQTDTDNHSLIRNGSRGSKDSRDSRRSGDSQKSQESDKSDKMDDVEERSSSDSIHPPKEDWGHKADYLLAVIGYAVDLSNVWRFPYLCYKNGGGAFIIPYFTVTIFGAMPIFFMEMAMGQFHREGPIKVWKIVPMFKGIGYASCYMAYIVAFYYNVIIGWSFFYMFSSFTLDLPWKSCDHSWNSPDCQILEIEEDDNITMATNVTRLGGVSNLTEVSNSSISSSFEFFERGMLHLHLSRGIENLGFIRWQLLLCVMLTFVCLYFSLWKGVKSSGKVVYVTATMPYIILTILLIRGCLLPGAVDGIKYFITPNVERLNDPNVWIDAAVQIMFSIGCGFGTHIAYSSHNKFNNNCYMDCLFTTAVNSFTSIFSGFVVFSYLGYMAARQQKDIDSVAQEGPGLVFIVYPEAIATLPGSTIWAVIFFLMLITLGMDSAFGGLESPLTGLSDKFYRVYPKKHFREVLTLIIIGSAFVLSIPCTTYGGMYVFRLLDTFAAGTSILFVVLCEVVAIAWFYGIDQFCQDIHKMTGYLPGLYWRISWKYLSPTFLIIIIISSILHFKPLVYEGGMGKYVYPNYINAVGWLIAGSSMIMVPTYALYYIYNKKGTLRERLSLGISPKWEHSTIKENREVKRFKREHWVYI